MKSRKTSDDQSGKASTNEPVRLTVGIRPGYSTPAMKSQWLKFWMRLAAECQRELKDESEGKK